MTGIAPTTVQLWIYIQAHCYTCEHSKVLAKQLQAEFPTINVALVDFADPKEQRHPKVFATPTFVLNNAVVSLGNPELEQMRYLINKALNKRQRSRQP